MNSKETMEALKIISFRQNLLEAIKKCGLPVYIVQPILKEYYDEINRQYVKYMNDTINEYVKEKESKEEN